MLASEEEPLMPGDLSDVDLVQLGFIPGMPGMVLGPHDPRPGCRPAKEQPEDIWEEQDGIRTRYQGATLLLTEPLLWGPFMEWRMSGHELSRIDLRSMSHFEVEAIYAAAHARARKMFPKKDGNGGA